MSSKDDVGGGRGNPALRCVALLAVPGRGEGKQTKFATISLPAADGWTNYARLICLASRRRDGVRVGKCLFRYQLFKFYIRGWVLLSILEWA